LKAGDEVNEEVAGKTFAVVLKAAPAEEADGVEGTRRSVANEFLPVDGLGGEAGSNGIDPSAGG